MKHRIITLVILLAVSLLGALDAELTELSYIDCNFQPKYSYLDSNNTLNLYTVNGNLNWYSLAFETGTL